MDGGIAGTMDTPLDLNSYIRVLKLARTPTSEEFFRVAGVAAAGIGLIGFIGFVIFLLMSFLPG